MPIITPGAIAPIESNKIINTILHNPEIFPDFLCMALFEELVRTPNPNIANFFVFIHEYERVYRELLQTDEKYWNVLVQKMVFDQKRFSEFFMRLYNDGLYGVWFLESEGKKEAILNIIENKEGARNLHLSHPLESILKAHISLDRTKNGITEWDDTATFHALRHDKCVCDAIEWQLIAQIAKLRENLATKFEKKSEELRGEVQYRVDGAVKGKDL